MPAARASITSSAPSRTSSDITHVIPTHQGRAAERILFNVMCKKGDVVPNNTHFDTTRANVEFVGAEAVDLPIPEARQPETRASIQGQHGRCGAEELIARVGRERIPLVMLTVTNNSGGGQPVSMENAQAVAAVCRQAWDSALLRRLPLCRERIFHQAARTGIRSPNARSRLRRRCSRWAMAAPCRPRKTAWPTSAAFSAPTTTSLARQEQRPAHPHRRVIPHMAGLAGRDLEAVAVGLQESLDEDYLRYRIASTAYLGNHIAEHGVPIVQPPGGHADLHRCQSVSTAHSVGAVSGRGAGHGAIS